MTFYICLKVHLEYLQEKSNIHTYFAMSTYSFIVHILKQILISNGRVILIILY